jgi:hypothetical protein
MSDSHLVHIESQIEYDKLVYPSDQLSIKKLSLLFPENQLSLICDNAERLDAMRLMERSFVTYGYVSVLDKAALPHAEDLLHPEDGRDGAIRDLGAEYVHFDLANGPESARELIRRLEEAGAGLARIRLGLPHP